MAKSLKEAAKTPQANPWYRAVYRGDEPVGFVMLSWTPPAGPYEGRYFLWRLLIDKRYQKRGIGREVLTQITELVRADGAAELLTSYEPGEGETWPFYQQFGFEPTGEIDDGEIVLRLSSRLGEYPKLRSGTRAAPPPRVSRLATGRAADSGGGSRRLRVQQHRAGAEGFVVGMGDKPGPVVQAYLEVNGWLACSYAGTATAHDIAGTVTSDDIAGPMRRLIHGTGPADGRGDGSSPPRRCDWPIRRSASVV